MTMAWFMITNEWSVFIRLLTTTYLPLCSADRKDLMRHSTPVMSVISTPDMSEYHLTASEGFNLHRGPATVLEVPEIRCIPCASSSCVVYVHRS